ncbi:hypothetical protein CSC70_00725 [Pseudoxanthomonas kalamensis DSM 18571]|uniref:alkyl/aryl-sulfatase n=1 Tax=Pseudoxanthomonas kalamensis TaxID=289483 RepID=UPI001390847D|nr:alkyl sulfatase dimerization domain-containing protein [Pseudoxanthomonas kalamensis]KAF1712089.1 hypothetical protein CSC70_00725 [Pseudoxanthomonas kalamensis DSM 18571]
MKISSRLIGVVALGVLITAPAAAQSPVVGKPATAATKAANAAVQEALPFNDKQDFEDAERGLMDRPERLLIKDKNGAVVWDANSYSDFIKLDAPAPDTVNPSLWRNAQLNALYGLYKVSDRIYQVRGYDLSNLTVIQSDTGWLVFDTMTTVETSRAAMDLVEKHLGKRPVKAVVHSHSHVDHYGGVRGLVDEADVKAGKVKIIVPEGFMEHAISENVTAGNAMSRRAIFMYGALLPRSPTGGVNAGLGMTNPLGENTLIEPTDIITKSGTEMTIDGVKMVFQLTPGTEAPAEMNTYFPQLRALWMAENTTNTMHNILTLRGAQVRDAKNWAHYIDETIALYGDNVDVKFQSHHWPMWGHDRIIDYLKKQRDLYKYIHDQSVRMLNMGYTGEEISEMIKLPPELEQLWSGRGYYGSLRHNSRAVYQRYMGWYDGNPSDLNNLPPEMAAKKYVEYMGGASDIVKRAKADFDKGEYRWVATALKHVVFADPSNTAAKELLADAYEQMGYQAESGPWRSVYLQGASELRTGTPDLPLAGTDSPDTIRAMPPEMLFDYMAVKLNGERAAGKNLNLNINFSDLGEAYTLSVENGVLNYSTKLAANPDSTVTLTKKSLDDVQLGDAKLKDLVASGDIKVEGNEDAWAQFFGLMDEFGLWFNIVTP